MLNLTKRKPTIHWGSQDGYRVISFSDGTAEFQKMNSITWQFQCIDKGKEFDIVSSHFHWIVFCEGKIKGYRVL